MALWWRNMLLAAHGCGQAEAVVLTLVTLWWFYGGYAVGCTCVSLAGRWSWVNWEGRHNSQPLLYPEVRAPHARARTANCMVNRLTFRCRWPCRKPCRWTLAVPKCTRCVNLTILKSCLTQVVFWRIWRDIICIILKSSCYILWYSRNHVHLQGETHMSYVSLQMALQIALQVNLGSAQLYTVCKFDNFKTVWVFGRRPAALLFLIFGRGYYK